MTDKFMFKIKTNVALKKIKSISFNIFKLFKILIAF